MKAGSAVENGFHCGYCSVATQIHSGRVVMSAVTTEAGFTAILCGDCRDGRELPVLDALREAVGRCPHGVLVSAPCQLGDLWCRDRPEASDGKIVLVQPCDTERRPTGAVIPVGPIRSREDLASVATWMSSPLDRGALPQHLRAPLARPQRS
jgi:hypothetical protein